MSGNERYGRSFFDDSEPEIWCFSGAWSFRPRVHPRPGITTERRVAPRSSPRVHAAPSARGPQLTPNAWPRTFNCQRTPPPRHGVHPLGCQPVGWAELSARRLRLAAGPNSTFGAIAALHSTFCHRSSPRQEIDAQLYTAILEHSKKFRGHAERGFLAFGIACREAARPLSGKPTGKAWEARAGAREHGRLRAAAAHFRRRIIAPFGPSGINGSPPVFFSSQ